VEGALRNWLAVLIVLASATPVLADPYKWLQIEVPPPVEVKALDNGSHAAAVSLTRIAADLKDGEPWMDFDLANCGRKSAYKQYTWEAKNNQLTADPEFVALFDQELKSGGFAIAGSAQDLFADDHTSDLQVGALIKALKVWDCDRWAERGGEYTQRGRIDMRIEWQIYSVAEGKVLARIPTDGGFETDKIVGPTLTPFLKAAFAENVRALIMSPDFRRIVTSSGVKDEAPTKKAPVAIALRTSSGATPISEDAKAAVTIHAGDGMGSGVLISSDGYILTNHHVVGEAGRVRITWGDRTESVGEVVRSDPARDVALIKAQAVSGSPIPIRHRPVELGEPVFAIGTPLDEALQNTVTKGVVSGTRLVNGHAFIQSDAPVTHGNSGGPLVDRNGFVIGLTDWGVDPKAGSSLNFFIPIEEALKALAIEPAAARGPDPPPQGEVARRAGGGSSHRARGLQPPQSLRDSSP
jgi:S1-C subfamily serine protease